MTLSRDPSDALSHPPPSEGLPELTEEEGRFLHRVVRDSIERGLQVGQPLVVESEETSEALRVPLATFVTLKKRGGLRGCVGSYVPCRPLVEDVAHNAFAAAFRDPRFPPLRQEELGGLQVHISLLTPLVPLDVGGRGELRESLRPGIDGLFLEDPPHQATFLPQVWESLPDPEDFIRQLFLKAGLGPDHWSPTLTFKRYRVKEI